MILSRISVNAVLLLGVILCMPGFLFAAENPSNYLEIDGNSVYSTGGTDDWDLLNGDGTTGADGDSLVRTFVSGDASIKIFTGGGSKDPLDIPSWKWREGGAPDKNAITNGYAAAYQGSISDLILMFGADRYAVNGDANIGFWFFQDEVAPVAGGGFSGTHKDNDIFVVSAFTQGGGTSTITAYKWDSTCTKGVKDPGVGDCADSNLRKIFGNGSNTCPDGGCATVNSAPIQVSWPYLAKFGDNTHEIPTGGFYEGGLDIDALLGPNLTCLSSFLIETRSSQSTDAVLKDFISGSFDICGMDITKNCTGDGTVNAGGTSIHYKFDGTVTNTGVATVYDTTIVDTLPTGATSATFYKGTYAIPPATPGDPTTLVTSGDCPAGYPTGTKCANIGDLPPKAVIKWAVEFDSTLVTVENRASARGTSTDTTGPGACSAAGTICTATGEDGIDQCTTSPTNSITVTKNCGVPADWLETDDPALPGTQLVTAGGYAAAQVNFSGQVCNTGQTLLTGITLTDSPAADDITLLDNSLAPGECSRYAGYYKPDGVTYGDLGSAVGRYTFTDTIKVTGATATFGDDPGHEYTCTGDFLTDAQACASAPCSMCPPGSCACPE